MAQHESRHFGALALVAGLLDSASKRSLRTATALTPARVQHLRRLLAAFEAEAGRGVTIERAFEIALEVESSEIEDVVLDLLQALKGEAERERAVKLLIHDLGDLSYMIEKHTSNHALLARADRCSNSRWAGCVPRRRRRRAGCVVSGAEARRPMCPSDGHATSARPARTQVLARWRVPLRRHAVRTVPDNVA